jgi:dihydroorotase-like cyclic amidohydrolase
VSAYTSSAASCYLLDVQSGIGRVTQGAPADLVIFDPSCTWRFTPEESASRSENSLFLGTEFRGGVEMVLVDGRVVVEQRKLGGKER